MCTSVTVIESGRIRGSGSVADVTRSVTPRQRVYLRALAGPEALERSLLEMPRIAQTRRENGGVSLEFEGSEPELAVLVEQLVAAKLSLVEIKHEALDLEDVFLSLTEGKLQ
jgi:ABC-type uncharacterized transport system ATPase subunit